jgi:hypothetical protein
VERPIYLAELAELALEAAVAPAGVLPRQLEDELFDLGSGGRATAGTVPLHGPLAAHQLTVPLQDRIGLEEQDVAVQPRPRAGGQARHFAGEDREGELLPAGEARRRALALQEAHLVLQEEDLQVLVAVGPPPRAEQVDEERHEMREHEPAHQISPPLPNTGRRPGPPLLGQS